MALPLSPIKVTQVDIGYLNIPFTHPINTPIANLDAAHNVVVKITTSEGITGWGEASPFAPITGDCQETNYITAQKLATLILGKDPTAVNARMNDLNHATTGSPSIRSAFDMALYDIASRSANMPLYQYLGGELRQLRTNYTIGIQDNVEETLIFAKRILSAGFKTIKMKVGRPGLVDVEHVAAVRQLVDPNIAIKIDSNQGWDYATALKNLKAMSSLDLEYSEQPLAAKDFTGLAQLRNSLSIPICADESVFNHHDALQLIQAEAVDYLNIKLGKAGGISTALKINSVAEAANIKCMIGCFGESRLGLTAAAHLAMAKPNIAFLDLDSAFHFKTDPVTGGGIFDFDGGGMISLPNKPGLDAEIDEAKIEKSISFKV